jgi:hypothetical protein
MVPLPLSRCHHLDKRLLFQEEWNFMATKSKPHVKFRGLPKTKNNPGLGQAMAPILNKQSGEKIMAMSELDQLEDKRRGLAAQLEEIETQMLELKKKRREELLAELEGLGLDMAKVKTKGASEGGKQRGRPKGYTMSEEHKQAMRDGRAKAKAARAAGTSSVQ